MGKKEIVIGIYKAPFTLNKESLGVSFFSILVHYSQQINMVDVPISQTARMVDDLL